MMVARRSMGARRSARLACACLVIAVPVTGQTTAFTHVGVLSLDRGTLIPDQTVIVRGDRIVRIGPADRTAMPPGATAIDGRNRVLLPGFADMHVHLDREGDLLTYVANGVTTVRSMSGDTIRLGWRRRVAAGSLLGPRIVTAGPILDGNPPSLPSMLVITDPTAVRRIVTEQHDRGYDFIKVYNSLPKAVYDSIVVVARELRMPVAGHVPFTVGLAGVFRAHQASIEHLRGYIAELVPKDAPLQPGPSLRSRSIAWTVVDRTRFAALVQATKAAGTYNTPTLMVTPELLAPPETWDSLARRPALRFLGPGATGDRSQIPFLRDFTADDYRAANRGLDAQRALVKALADGGAPIMAGTDSYLQGFALREELRELERAGLTRLAVLRAATTTPAQFLGEAADWGEIGVGRRADLQLLGADPLRSLDALDGRLGVMVRGRWLSREELDARLETLARTREAR